ncbi:MAG TPA: hypothetical protein VIO11_10160, partial [Candidatus Methanoperedens sp.]
MNDEGENRQMPELKDNKDDRNRSRKTFWYLSILIIIAQIFSIASMFIVMAREEDKVPVELQKNSTHDPGTSFLIPFQVNTSNMIPEDAMNIEFFMELGEEGHASNSVQIIQGSAVIGKPVRWTISDGSSIVRYETPGAWMTTESIDDNIIRVVVNSGASVHYHNVTAFLAIPETKKDDQRLFWLDKDKRRDVTVDPAYNLTFKDTNGNGLIDNIQWNVPGLSSQVFEVETLINITNVQSYPAVRGNWIVLFNTSGTANLTITPVNGTIYDSDIEFQGLWCGETEMAAVYNGTSVSSPGWNCTHEGKIINRVITSGKHTLKFGFGDAVQYAYNMVNSNLNLTSGNLTFSYLPGQQSEVLETGEAKEGINLAVDATIYNQGISESGPFHVLFYDGSVEFYNISIPT